MDFSGLDFSNQDYSLTLEQQALLDLLLAEDGISLTETPIQPRDESEPAPLSFAQQRLWFLDQLAPGLPVYNIPAAYYLQGPLDQTALQRALNEIVHRHAVLRTTFAQCGQPMQVIAPKLEIPLTIVDLQNLAPDACDAALRCRMVTCTWQAFDLRTGPLLRAMLLVTAPEVQVLLLVFHHSVADGWSLSVFQRELNAIYPAFASGRPSPLPDLPFQYADFAAWQRKWLSGDPLAAQIAYWKQKLAGAPSMLEILTDRPRPPVQTFHGSIRRIAFPGELAHAIQKLSQRENATLFMTLLAAFGVLLYRYSHQHDIVIGTVIANRNRREIEELIGYFANTLLLRLDLDHNPTFQELLVQVRDTALDAYSHQDIPFERLVEELHPARDLSRNPLFQVMFALQSFSKTEENASRSGEHWQGNSLDIRPMDVEMGASRVDLSLVMEETPHGLVGMCEFSTDLFDAATIDRFLVHYQNLLASIVAGPGTRIADLEILSPQERHQILVTWNETAQPFSLEQLTHQQIEAVAQRQPDAVAVISSTQIIPYKILNRRANQIAHYLRFLGVGPDSLVGVLFERSAEMILAELAVMKAGGAFVPLDPTYPADRLAFMVEDARLKVVLTMSHLEDRLPASVKRISIDHNAPMFQRWPDTNLTTLAAPANLAYVIYTSGSTGKPKGAMIQHDNLLHLLHWHRHTFHLQEGDRVGHLAGPAFDGTVLEIWPALTSGSTVYVIDDETRASPDKLRDFLVSNRIRLNYIPTVLTEILLAEPWPQESAFEYLLTGGEKLNRRPPASFQPTLINLYGPTETTVLTSYARIAPGPDEDTPPIGRPIDNIQFYILDEYLHPVPVGVSGELYIGGAGVGRGYLNRPELTAERFILNPFKRPTAGSRMTACSRAVGERLYKTGDLCRYLPNGNVQIIGRSDHQVKIRGLRIELGEIETTLCQHPDIKDASVIAWQDGDGHKRLAAYFLRANGRTPSNRELRHFLKERVPGYMVPAAFTCLTGWPVTANGKFDTHALPAPHFTVEEQDDPEQTPRGPIEAALAEIWSAVLDLPRVGRRDNFFEIGGHSLLAMQVLNCVEARLRRKLPLTALFQSPTIESLAQILCEQNEPTQSAQLVPIRACGSRDPFFLVHGGMGTIVPFYDLDNKMAAEMNAALPFYAFQAKGLLHDQPIPDSIEALASSYIQALRRLLPAGPYRLGGWSMGGVIALEMAQQICAQGEQVAALILLDSWAPDPAPIAEHTIREEFIEALLGHKLSTPVGLDRENWLASLMATELISNEMALPDVKRMYRVYRTNVLAWQKYQPRPYSGPAILLRAAGIEPGHSTNTPARLADDPEALGWQELLVNGMVLDIPGGHYSMFKPPYIQALAAILAEVL